MKQGWAAASTACFSKSDAAAPSLLGMPRWPLFESASLTCTTKMPAWAHLTPIRISLTRLLVAPRAGHSQLRVLMVSPLEKERNERVASNKRRLEELGIQEAAQQLKAAPVAQR